ncbi:M48 family metalloprotease [Actinospica durhamensis]|uniref:M48 family metalloprotease n=1 Tax=Actinospica durhamensis TaxID=1508375 RepID=A0A941ET04_9ACTN|nr:M48 family metalloprotease [Actinospica durhamensis]MBR7835912.1 M48 family metalloprotease [Actinospica durhamensis]
MALRRFSEGGPRPDRTALLSLGMVVLFAPLAALCLLPLLLLLGLTGLPLRLGYALWVLTACLYGLRPVQLALAKLLWPVRRPTQGEQQRLDEVWSRVLRRAAVSERRFRIWVVDLADVNAHCVGRDLICVTTGALAELGDRELAGVLAHELGHHLRMHTAAAAFLVWVLLPLQAVSLVGSGLALPFARMARGLGSADGVDCVFGARRAAVSVLARLESGLRLVFAAPGMLAFAVKNAAGRTAEFQVDAYAVDLGFGAELLSALRWFEACAQPPQVQPLVPGPRRARHAAVREARPTHPPLERRMARITARLAVESAAEVTPGAAADVACAAVPGQGAGPEGRPVSRTLLP